MLLGGSSASGVTNVLVCASRLRLLRAALRFCSWSAMTLAPMSSRGPSWKWVVCGLLLLASAINYMDRQTLANASVRISKEFGLNQTQYGNVEAVFGYAFAAGSLVFGWLADRVSVRWLYAIVLALWSVAGFATGFVKGYDELLMCRIALGFFEAGHWPC